MKLETLALVRALIIDMRCSEMVSVFLSVFFSKKVNESVLAFKLDLALRCKDL